MRHKKKVNHLGRTASHKKALMRNMAAQLIEHKEIKTTLAKAKELRGYVERLITYGKKGAVHHRRLAFKFLQNKEAVHELFESIASAYEDRNGGYTRIIKLGQRKGDGASVAVMQLVGYEAGAETAKPEKTSKKASKKAEPKKEKESKPEAKKEEKPADEAQAPAEEKAEVKEAPAAEEKETKTDETEDK